MSDGQSPPGVSAPGESAPGETFGVERLSALTDGVFAIILTLLVLELELPQPGSGETVFDSLAENWHIFVAWLISFFAVARFWVVHHAVTATLGRCTSVTIGLNFAVLGASSLIPFSADTIGDARLVEPWSTVVFAANFAAVSFALGLLARHVATEPALLKPGQPASALDPYRRHHLVVLPLVSLAAGLLAFTAPYLAVTLLFAESLAVTWWSLRRPRTLAQPPGDRDGPGAQQRAAQGRRHWRLPQRAGARSGA